MLAAVLPQLPSLWFLSLEENSVGGAGAADLGAAVPQLQSLVHLGLAFNFIVDAAVLVAVLPPSLQQLDLRGNRISEMMAPEPLQLCQQFSV